MGTKRKPTEPPTGIRFDGDVRRWLVEYAAEHDLTVSQVVRRAVAQYRADVLTVSADVVRKAGW